MDDLHMEFHQLINEIHESIQFTMEFDEHNLPFLDIMIMKEGEEIKTDLYCKITDTHQYLNFRSCHPSHTKRNIPFNLSKTNMYHSNGSTFTKNKTKRNEETPNKTGLPGKTN